MNVKTGLPARQDNAALGTLLMICATFIFAMQDGISRHLGGTYNVFMIVMIRYWVFAAVVIALSLRGDTLRRALGSERRGLQFFRGALLALEIFVMVTAFVRMGLVDGPAIFSAYPLLITALSGPILGERIGWRRWALVFVGFIGVIIIINPGSGVISFNAIFPFASALGFALYGILNRYVARFDAADVTFFYTGVAGAVVTTLVGIWFWEPMLPVDWLWMALLCMTSISSHFLLIKAYEASEASAIQPFAYLQLPFSAVLGVFVFGDVIRANVMIGATIVVGAGLFTFLRARQLARRT
ncbi:DMT family transporter [Celeribacter neptunius]|uniref:Permease of the drug/metabolite transporter (DMT) superfamily n=1 Tax=Celeribacter neptunius TaxID=588602 RepID=A0A1I3WZI9_9RHOB|nr:DMT family transporter [Celeribacter neptunius]SFK12912.1 Permease of the drug/metabolite transporter (DMT) superfamily [Celeribacter neptunius]